jgi:hypothetical protein
LAQGQDPLQVKKAAKVAKAAAGANTFAAIAGELAEKKRRDKKAAAFVRKKASDRTIHCFRKPRSRRVTISRFGPRPSIGRRAYRGRLGKDWS